MQLNDLLSKFQNATKSGNGYKALCPAHNDKTPSLSITEKDGKILVHCFAGCSTESVLDAVGLTMQDLNADGKSYTPTYNKETSYPYHDERGKLLYEKIRIEKFRDGKKIKDFRFSPKLKDEDTRVLYRLPEILKAKERNEIIFFVEGEKDADNLRALALTATTTDCGANAKWIEANISVLEPLHNAHVAVLCDNDYTGKQYALTVCKALHGKVKSLKFIDFASVVQGFPEKADVSDWLAFYQGDKDKLLDIVRNTIEFNPNHSLYQLQRLNGNQSLPETESESESEFEYEPTSDEVLAFRPPQSFDELLLYDGLMKELFGYYKSVADVPDEFLFVSTLATLCAIVGGRATMRCGTVRITPHDYFIVLSKSGTGKSTALAPVSELLEALENRVVLNETNLFLYPQRGTERAYIDIMRDESFAEQKKAKMKKRKDAEPEPERVPQRNGIIINDEIVALFEDARKDYNSGFDSTILRLWDGRPISFATSEKNDGRIKIGETALTIIGASTPEKFRERLPKNAFTDGLIARLQFCFAPSPEKPRTPLSEQIETNNQSIIDELVSFFQFVAKLSKNAITIDATGKDADKKSV
ncbi:MAG: DUF3987 domain-containing protein, partial [Chloroherpetonaceae bacterium]